MTYSLKQRRQGRGREELSLKQRLAAEGRRKCMFALMGWDILFKVHPHFEEE